MKRKREREREKEEMGLKKIPQQASNLGQCETGDGCVQGRMCVFCLLSVLCHMSFFPRPLYNIFSTNTILLFRGYVCVCECVHPWVCVCF